MCLFLYVKSDYSGKCLQNATVVNQSGIDGLLKTQYKDSICIQFLLAGGNTYMVNMMKVMSLATNGSLIMRSDVRNNGSLAEINCAHTDASDDGKALKEMHPLLRASLILLDGLIFTGCSAPILIEEASNVVIQNCIFQ